MPEHLTNPADQAEMLSPHGKILMGLKKMEYDKIPDKIAKTNDVAVQEALANKKIKLGKELEQYKSEDLIDWADMAGHALKEQEGRAMFKGSTDKQLEGDVDESFENITKAA